MCKKLKEKQEKQPKLGQKNQAKNFKTRKEEVFELKYLIFKPKLGPEWSF